MLLFAAAKKRRSRVVSECESRNLRKEDCMLKFLHAATLRPKMRLALCGAACLTAGLFCGWPAIAAAQSGKGPADPQVVDEGGQEDQEEPVPQRVVDPQRPDDKPGADQGSPQTPASPAYPYPRVVRLELSPAAEPMPALKYSLLPTASARKTGNAATRYYRAMMMHLQVTGNQQGDARKQYTDAFSKLLDQPLADFDVTLADTMFPATSGTLREIREGAARENCDWSLQLQQMEGMEVVSFLLPDVQEMRTLSRLLTIQAKRNMVQKKWDEAISDVQSGYQLGIHACAEPILISNLVGIAIAQQMNNLVEQSCGQPDSPNLYWALAMLPEEQWSMHRAMDVERDFLFRMFPYLRDAETVDRTASEWQTLFDKSLADMDQLGLASGVLGAGKTMQGWEARLQMTAMLTLSYSGAKAELIKSGMPKEKVEKMPIGQVAAIQTARTYRYVGGEMAKWNYLPYDKIGQRQEETMNRLKGEGWLSPGPSAKDPLSVCSLLLPAMEQVRRAEVRLQQQIAGLQTIEAIRMQMAKSGKLPQTLEEVEVVPVPDNPATGKPFPYTVKDGMAELRLDGLPLQNQVIYQLKAR